MPQCYAVALPNGSQANLDIGLANNVWGWKDSALDQNNTHEGRPRRSIAEAIAPGDQLLLAIGTPGRTPSWDAATLRRVFITEVRRGFYRSDVPVWPDETYPNRVDLLFLTELQNVDAARIGLPAMRALRWAFHSQSTPCSVPELAALPLDVGPTPRELAEAERDLSTEDLLADDGSSLDAESFSRRRREQAALRRQLFGGTTLAECALCGRSLPPALLRAAHIKRRADATDAERRNVANLMPACALGCDELFERGYLTVAADGRINLVDTGVDDLSVFTTRLRGRKASIDVAAAQPFLTWHRERHGSPT